MCIHPSFEISSLLSLILTMTCLFSILTMKHQWITEPIGNFRDIATVWFLLNTCIIQLAIYFPWILLMSRALKQYRNYIICICDYHIRWETWSKCSSCVFATRFKGTKTEEICTFYSFPQYIYWLVRKLCLKL